MSRRLLRFYLVVFRVVIGAGLALLLAPVAQARPALTAASIVGTWTNANGLSVAVEAQPGSGYIGRWVRSGSCTSFQNDSDKNVWLIDSPSSPSSGSYSGATIVGGGPDPNGMCWTESTQPASWLIDSTGTSLVMTFVSSGLKQTWTKSGGTATDSATAARDNAVRTGVNKTFKAISKANLPLSRCKWGHCRKAAVGLQRVAQHWYDWCATGKHGQTSSSVTAGLRATKTALSYWTQTATAAIETDSAYRAGNTTSAKHWYGVYRARFTQAEKYEKRAWKLLWPG